MKPPYLTNLLIFLQIFQRSLLMKNRAHIQNRRESNQNKEYLKTTKITEYYIKLNAWSIL